MNINKKEQPNVPILNLKLIEKNKEYLPTETDNTVCDEEKKDIKRMYVYY